MTYEIPLSQPSISALEKAYVKDAIESGWISGTGPYIEKFEAALSRRIGRTHVVATSSGTVALEVALRAIGISPGDQVIVPALTFVAPAAAVLAVGATPVICDISSETWTIERQGVEPLLTESTKAIIGVDLLGHPCDFEQLAELDVPLIEDAAQAHGSVAFGRPAGSFGLVSVFSFHANKTITTGEGGCLATDNEELASRSRLVLNHGMRSSRPYFHEVQGTNGRMTNITAAIGVAQAERWDELVSGRRRVSEEYRRLLSDVDGVDLSPEVAWAEPVCWLKTVQSSNRNRVVQGMRAAGIDARGIWPALPELPLYQQYAPRACPNAERAARSSFWLPTWSEMTSSTIERVIAELRAWVH